MQMSEERKAYLKMYKKEKLKRIPLEVTTEFHERLKAEAKRQGLSVNGLIKRQLEQALNEPIS